MAAGVHTAPLSGHLDPPTVAEVFRSSNARIHRAAASLWPEDPVTLETHVPSVTGYVHRVRVGDRSLFAKTSFLGVSLVSLLRGTYGSWDTVCQAQRDYVRRADGLIAREAAQLQLLSRLDGPLVCPVVGMRDGVIFTEAVPGPTLTDLLLDQPERAHELLERPLAELKPLHRPGAARRLDPAGTIGERSITGTFLRKFNGAAAEYVDDLGMERCDPDTRAAVAELVRASVARLNGLRMTLPSAAGTSLAYGDLKPEHVVFPDGPDCRPVFLDPGVLRASSMVDVAKLMSRTVLVLVAHRPAPHVTRQILDALALLALSHAGHLSAPERRTWLRHLLTLWLMDTLNITTTYLSAPAALPLPRLGAALIERVLPLCLLLDSASADLLAPAARGAEDRILDRITEVTA